MLRNFAYALLYMFLFFLMNVLFALFIGQDPAFFAGGNALYLLGAFLSFKSKDVFRCVFIVLVLAFFGSYGAIDEGPILPEFFARFFINIIILMFTTFLYVKLTDIFEKIENKEHTKQEAIASDDVEDDENHTEETGLPIVFAEEFLSKTSGGRPCEMELSPYYGYEFSCACGKEHTFNSEIEVIRELNGMRLVFLCPDDENYITCVKIRGHLKFIGFKSLFGTSGEREPNSSRPQKEVIKKTSIQLLNEAVESLKQIVECHNPIKIKIVVLSIYKSIVESQRPRNNEAQNADEVIRGVLENNDELYYEFERYFYIYITNHDEIAITDKDDSTKLFLMAQIHAMYLFREKRDHELVNETFTIVQYYSLILKIANMIKP